MRKVDIYATFQDYFEYHGGTTIERVRKSAGKTVQQQWLMFDSVEAAQEYFNCCCGV